MAGSVQVGVEGGEGGVHIDHEGFALRSDLVAATDLDRIDFNDDLQQLLLKGIRGETSLPPLPPLKRKERG